MASAMRPVLTQISMETQRPSPSARGTSRWQMMPRSEPARPSRTCFCSCGGKKSMTRLMVSCASVVCSVDMTKWPVSAAASAALTVSWSRISPTRMTSGSCRIAARRAVEKSSVSTRTSRWLIIASLSKCRTSIGSSIVTAWTSRLVLMWSIMPARVVVLPEPVGPVTRARPRGSRARLAMTRGRPRSSGGGGAAADRRQAQLVERDRADGDPPEDQPGGTARAEGVDAEPADPREGVGEVGLVAALELLDQVGTQDLAHHRLGVGRGQIAGLELAQPAVDPHPGRRTDLAMQVGTAALDECAEEGLDGQSRGHEVFLGFRNAGLDPCAKIITPNGSLDDRDHVAFLHDVALVDPQLLDGAPALRRYRDLHLHRLEDDQGVALLDAVAGADHDFPDIGHHLGADFLGHASSFSGYGQAIQPLNAATSFPPVELALEPLGGGLPVRRLGLPLPQLCQQAAGHFVRQLVGLARLAVTRPDLDQQHQRRDGEEDHGQHEGGLRGAAQRPDQFGGRFSKNAAMPSATSLVVVSNDSWACIASSAAGSGAVSAPATHAAFPSRTATGAAAASLATYAVTASSKPSSGRTRETRPMAYAVRASNRSPVSM